MSKRCEQRAQLFPHDFIETLFRISLLNPSVSLLSKNQTTNIMGNKGIYSVPNKEIVEERKLPALLDDVKARKRSFDFAIHSGNNLRIVEKNLSVNSIVDVKDDLPRRKPITLCLSQNDQSRLSSCWYMGFLTGKDQRKSLNIKVDKQFPITDYRVCLRALNDQSSDCYGAMIEVLAVNLSIASRDASSALNNLRHAILELEDHLNFVKHVVVSISPHACQSFSFKDSIDQATGVRQQVIRKKALVEIVDDLNDCWKQNHTLIVRSLLAFFLDNAVKPVSEVYLAKFVISLNRPRIRALIKSKPFYAVSRKIMWVSVLVFEYDFKYFNQDTARLCHAIHLESSSAIESIVVHHRQRWVQAFCFKNSLFVEQIVIRAAHFGYILTLPRPSTPLTDTTPKSALVELTLQGYQNIFDLTQLNNHFFPHLTHLTLINGEIKGHLDSHCVPRLKTLILEPVNREGDCPSPVELLVRERTQSIIQSGLPWQVAATYHHGGWSLASCDKPIINLQSKMRQTTFLSSLQSPPRIREWMLVAFEQNSVHEWLSQLNGDSTVDADAQNPHVDHLVWAPKHLMTITAFCTSKEITMFDFKDIRPQLRSLTALSCYNFQVSLHGASLPCLQSLELHGGKVKLSGEFPHLETLLFQETVLLSAWELNTPRLESLCWHNVRGGDGLSLQPELLPFLSRLQMTLTDDAKCYPIVVDEEDPVRMSLFKYSVSDDSSWHLEFTVNGWELPDRWSDPDWQCDSLTLHVNGLKPGNVHLQDTPIIVVLPPFLQAKTLTVTEKNCQALLYSYMPNLTECTVPSPRSLCRKPHCPELERIRFTDELSESDMALCVDRALYKSIGAQPKEIIFAFENQVYEMEWDPAPDENELYPFLAQMEEVD